MTNEQLPLFDESAIIHTDGPERIRSHNIPFPPAIDPLSETEDVPAAPNHFISWDELQERWGYTPEQFAQADTTTMSPIEEEEPLHEQDIRSMIYTPDGPQ